MSKYQDRAQGVLVSHRPSGPRWLAPVAVSAFSTVGVHAVECGQRPPLWLPARHLDDALLLSAPPVHPVWRSALLADLPAALVPVELLPPRRLAERLTPDGGSLRVRRPAHLCAAGTMRAVRRDLQRPSEPPPARAVQSGSGADAQVPRGSVSGSLIPSLFRPRWPLSSAPPASSSVAFCLETWRTLRRFRPSRC